MRITILCSSPSHPVNPFLESWMALNKHHEISLIREKQYLIGGDLLFLISCSEIINAMDREKFSKTLVIHASDLPRGRGWSPHIWQIIEGAENVTVCLLEANDRVDTGDIWQTIQVHIPKHALCEEINQVIFRAELELMDYAVNHFDTVKPVSQNPDITPSYYPKRSPSDSQIDPGKSIEEQWDKLRVSDPERFPAFFVLHGHRYCIRLEKTS